jgi:hypothetical protein
MKKSKVFLAVSSCVLGIAAIGATRAQSRTNAPVYVQTQAGSPKCEIYTPTPCVQGADIQCTNGSDLGLYTSITLSGGCNVPLKRDAE